jgi:ornithine cyclodeaminase/alanine dehydrogenase-like protein (mu-crystallin family)
MRIIGADEVGARVPMVAAVDALEAAFRDEDPAAAAPLRSSVQTGAGTLLLMPAHGARGVGVKLVTLTPDNAQRGLPFIHGAYVLFDPVTQEPEAVMDGAALTGLRTAAVSGLATRWLANADAGRLLIFGAGVQARAHLDAMLAVRPVEELVVVSRTRPAAERLVARGRELGLGASVGEPEAVAYADLVCACTTSTTPLFDGSLLREGAHVNAVGTYLPDARELDTEAVRRARVAVEHRDVALAEAGDLLIPIAEGAITPEHVVADLSEVVGGAQVRRSPTDLTLFKSVGMAFEDLVLARVVREAVG